MSKLSLLINLALTRLPAPVARLAYLGRRKVVDGRVIDAKAMAMGELFNAVRVPGVEPTLAESRRSLSILAQKFDRPCPHGVNKRDIHLPGAMGERPARIYDTQPLDNSGRAVLLFIHGGGWVQGDLETHDGVCGQIAAEAGIRVIALDYRLAPEHKFPAGLDDVMAAYRALRATPDRYGIDATRIAVGGDSAGGNLTAALMHDLQETAEPLPAAQVLIYPAVDTRLETRSMLALKDAYVLPQDRIAWYLEQYLPTQSDWTSPRAAPIFSPYLAGQPPAVIVAAGHDPLWDDGLNYGAALDSAGVEVEMLRFEGQVHAFVSTRRAVPQGVEALSRVSVWLRGKLA